MFRTKRGALATTTKATRTSRTSMAARKTPPEDEGGDGAPQKKMRNLSPPENPIVDTPIPQSGDMSKQLEQIMTKFMTGMVIYIFICITFALFCI